MVLDMQRPGISLQSQCKFMEINSLAKRCIALILQTDPAVIFKLETEIAQFENQKRDLAKIFPMPTTSARTAANRASTKKYGFKNWRAKNATEV